MKSEDEHFEELAKRWGLEEILAKGIEEPKSFWEFMAGWPERRGFKRPLDVLKTLSIGESADENLKEAATVLFWYAYYYSDPALEKKSLEYAAGKYPDNKGLLEFYLETIDICSDVIDFRDKFALQSIQIPDGPHRLSVYSYVTLMAAAAKVFLLLKGSGKFDADLIELLKNTYANIESGKVAELEYFSKDKFVYDGQIIKGDIFGFSACIATGIICSSYAHLKTKSEDFLVAFLANCKAAICLEKAAACLGEYIEVFDLPCCEHGFDCIEIQRTVDMWEEIKKYPAKIDGWDKLKQALRELDDISWPWVMDEGLHDTNGQWYPEDVYFQRQYGFCDAQIEDEKRRKSLERKACLAEGHLRKFVLTRLKGHYGSAKWWKQGVTGGAKKKADEMWEKEVTGKPGLQGALNEKERKFELLGLGEMIQIVTSGQNWKEVFEPVFRDKDNFEHRIKNISALRNPVSHERPIDEQDLADGTSGLIWLSGCLNDPELAP